MLSSRQTLTPDVWLVHKNIPQISIEDAVAFIRSYGELVHWTDDQIKIEITKASRNAALAFTTNEHSKIASICFGKWQDGGKIFFCYCIIAPNCLHQFVKALKRIFPDCKKIVGHRLFGTLTVEYDVNSIYLRKKQYV